MKFWKEIVFILIALLPVPVGLYRGLTQPAYTLAGLSAYYVIFTIPISYLSALILRFVFKKSLNFNIISIGIFVPIILLLIIGLIVLLRTANIASA